MTTRPIRRACEATNGVSDPRSLQTLWSFRCQVRLGRELCGPPSRVRLLAPLSKGTRSRLLHLCCMADSVVDVRGHAELRWWICFKSSSEGLCQFSFSVLRTRATHGAP